MTTAIGGRTHRVRNAIIGLGVAVGSLGVASGIVSADGTYDVAYTGQGWTDGELGEEICGVENGAEEDGGYLLFVFTATKSSSATISGPWGDEPMTKTANGTFKFVSPYYSLDELGGVSATAPYEGRARNPQLVVSHGCADDYEYPPTES